MLIARESTTATFQKAAETARAHSPFLSQLLNLHPQLLTDLKEKGADVVYAEFNKNLYFLSFCHPREGGDLNCVKREDSRLRGDDRTTLTKEMLMRELRVAKGRLALLTALCDIAEIWEVEQVTNSLSDFAENCLKITVDFLLAEAAKRGEITFFSCHSRPTLFGKIGGNPELKIPAFAGMTDSDGSGFIVLGMGKLGGRELNYSSDIDLILLYEPEKLGYSGRHTEQHFMNRLAHELVSIMQDRTADGYVFRTDLRLRPDPASTPPVVNVDAAYYYYEGVGQNWERAAMIKARALAGDIAAGERFLKSLTPFMWRKHLDFAAINDIHSIKRQMDTRESRTIKLLGHNIKLGLGGIREIEFFVQIHQLIWGGREASARLRATCDALGILRDLGLVDEQKDSLLREAYRYFRKVEHRIQMIADEQTHSLPETPEGVKNIAEFMGYENVSEFSEVLLNYLYSVHEIYANSFRSSAEELGDSGNLVFTGVSSDEETIKTLREMGYKNPDVVSEIVMGWHHGSSKATRSKRARELLTEMMPTILKRLAETANPDAAFLKFNEFLKNLPASVQLFSLFQMNPQLLGLIADIMGSAPSLAETLSHNPELLDAVLYADFYSELPSYAHLQEMLAEKLNSAEDFEDKMDILRKFRNEKCFQAGVQLLKNLINAHQASDFLSNLAELMVKKTCALALTEFEQTYGKIICDNATIRHCEEALADVAIHKNHKEDWIASPQKRIVTRNDEPIERNNISSRFAIIALGKLGSREMTFSSDLDLIFVYDTPDFDALSNGEKQFTASVYYNRFAQRLMNALAGMGRNGRLYEVDTRLRPSGKQGLLAVSLKALTHYFDELAWTFEYMALTKARALAGDSSLIDELEIFIGSQLTKDRDNEKLRADVADMRERMAKEFATENPWDIKNIRGGLTDIDFIAQYLLLKYAPKLVMPAQAGIQKIENMDASLRWHDRNNGYSARTVFIKLKKENCINSELADDLISANDFLGQIFNMLRLCSDKKFTEETAPEGLKKLLTKSVKMNNFAELKEKLLETEAIVFAYYQKIIETLNYSSQKVPLVHK